MKKIIIIGAGGLGRETLDTIERINEQNEIYEVLGFVDDAPELDGKSINGYKVLGGLSSVINIRESLCQDKLYAVIAIASAAAKRTIASKLEEQVVWETIIDPSAAISNYSKIGEGSIIQPGVFIGPNASIGKHCILNTKDTIGHDAIIEDYVSAMSFCDITGYVHLEEDVYLGSNVCIIPKRRIAKGTVLGAGALVVKDINESGTYVGMPVKRLR